VRRYAVTLLVSLLVLTMVLAPARAQAPGEDAKPFAFALFDPLQFPPRDASIRGVRLNAFYAVHRDLTGVDLGLIVPVNVVRGDFNGVQLGAVNLDHRRAQGLQVGLFNRAETMEGLQFGLVNMTRRLHGVQIGLVNIKQETTKPFPEAIPSPVMPFVNWSF